MGAIAGTAESASLTLVTVRVFATSIAAYSGWPERLGSGNQFTQDPPAWALMAARRRRRCSWPLAVDRGWLLVEGGHSVCLTDEGRRLAQ